ncbi:hypothetical protein H0H81_007318 [Sphagnurus paluster]|uniref:Uncharacterized protein n=1 Tax=Sphagnurus paluster TaxID=117069 RepID=A0A9P7K7N1_9AGAR|nr:hypothetical protein H0H81_007318 [Sphagnurus paluster]
MGIPNTHHYPCRNPPPPPRGASTRETSDLSIVNDSKWSHHPPPVPDADQNASNSPVGEDTTFSGGVPGHGTSTSHTAVVCLDSTPASGQGSRILELSDAEYSEQGDASVHIAFVVVETTTATKP